MSKSPHQVSNVVREVCSFENGQIKTNNMGYMKFFFFFLQLVKIVRLAFHCMAELTGQAKPKGDGMSCTGFERCPCVPYFLGGAAAVG